MEVPLETSESDLKSEEVPLETSDSNLIDFASMLHGKISRSTVLLNFTFATVHLGALLSGSLNGDGFPDLPDSFLELVAKYYPGSDLKSRLWTNMTSQKFRAALHVAALITPVALLMANRFDSKSLKRAELLEVSRQAYSNSVQACNFASYGSYF